VTDEFAESDLRQTSLLLPVSSGGNDDCLLPLLCVAPDFLQLRRASALLR
jgi:hypothetical protein